MDSVKLSIIIPVLMTNDHVRGLVMNYLQDIYDHSEGHEIIIVDNGGGEFCEKYASIYVKNNKNYGYGPAINQGFKLAHGDYLCALNDDIELPIGWAEPLIETLKNPLVGVVRPGEINEPGHSLVYDHTWYHGFCWIVSRETWQLLKDRNGNLLDEDFKIGNFEDLDLWQRMLRRGLKLAKNHSVKVKHYGGLTIKTLDHSEQNTKNEALFIKKHDMSDWREIFYPPHS